MSSSLKTLFFLLVFVFAGKMLNAQSISLEPATLEVIFHIKNAGIWVEGRFDNFEGKFQMQEGNPKSIQAKIKIDVASIDTGIGLRDRHLRGKGYFDLDRFPDIRFESDRVKLVEGNYYLVGKLKIKDVSRLVDIQLQFSEDQKLLIGRAAIDRRDFGVGGSSLTLSDQVEITLRVKLKP